MCGIFGYIGAEPLATNDVDYLVTHSQIRGRDSSGLIVHQGERYIAAKADFSITKLLKKVPLKGHSVFFGHSRLITNGFGDNQPVIRDGLGGAPQRDRRQSRGSLGSPRVWIDSLKIDTEIIPALARRALDAGASLGGVGPTGARPVSGRGGVRHGSAQNSASWCSSATTEACTLAIRSAARCSRPSGIPCEQIGCHDIQQVREPIVLDIPVAPRRSSSQASGRTPARI